MQPSRPEAPVPVAARAALALVLLWVAGAWACRFLGVWAGIGGAAILAGGLTWWLHGKALAPLLALNRRLVFLGLAGGALMTAATYVLYPLCVWAAPGLAGQTRALYALFNSGWAPLRLTILPLVILGEELVWRGLVQTVLDRRLGPAAGVLLGAAIYAAAHLPAAAPLLAVTAFCCGLYWGVLRSLTGSLAAPLIAHLVWDLFVMLLFPLV